MPLWLTIIIAILGLIGTILGIFGFSAYINERMKHKAERRNQAEDAEEKEINDMREQKKLEEIQKVINNALDIKLTPIISKLEALESDVRLVKTGVQVSNRTDLEEIASKADSQKFLSRYDKERFDQTYNAYHSLGRNGVMDATYNRVMALPDTKPSTPRKPRKKLLVEDK